MAGTVRGITIEFSGDATSLNNSLKEIERNTKAANSELGRVNNALKFNPASVTLLTQKQGLLTQKVQGTTEKLNTLKAQQQKMDAAGVNKNSAAYQKLQREIVQTESQLKLFKGQLAALGNVNLVALGTKFKEIGGKMTQLGKTWTTKVTAPIAALGGVATAVTIDFDTQMSKVKALSGATGKDFDDLKKKAREMGSKTSFSAKEAGEAFEYMALAGWDTKKMTKGIKPVLDLAAASAMDLGKASDIVTDGLTAFGMEAEDAAHFSDVLAKAQSKSNTNTEMLGEAFKYVAPVAGSMGYKVEDVAVALGTMANNGIKASQGGTTLRNIIQRMADPTEKVSAAMEDLGISLSDSKGNTKPLMEVMNDLRDTFGKNIRNSGEFKGEMERLNKAFDSGAITEEEYNKKADKLAGTIWGAEDAMKAQYASTIAGTRGMAGLLSIVNTSDEEWNNLTKEIYNCDGATSEMADTMLDNAGGAITILKSALQELAISFGEFLTPVIRKAAEVATGLANALANMSPTTKKIVLTIAGLLAAIGPILLIGGKIMTLLGSGMLLLSKVIGYVKMFGGVAGIVGKALAVITGPIGIAVVAIGSLVAALVYLYKTNKGVRKSIDGLFGSLKKAFGEVAKTLGPAIKGAFEALVSAVVELAKALAPLVKIWLAKLAVTIRLVAAALKIVLPWVIKLAGALLTSLANAIRVVALLVKGFATTISTAWTAIKTATTETYSKVSQYITGAMSKVSTKISDAVSSVKKAWGDMKSYVVTKATDLKDSVGEAIGKLKKTVTGAWSTMKEKATENFSSIKEKVNGVWDSIKEKAKDVWDAIKAMPGNAIAAAKKAVTTPIAELKDAVGSGWDALKKNVSEAWEKVKSAITSPIDKAKKALTKFKDKISSMFPFNLGKILKLKLPKIKVEGGKAPWGILGKGKAPKFSIDWVKWYAKGGIFRKPTIFNTKDGMKGVGEAGAEAVLPLDTLWEHMNMMADSIVNGIATANRIQEAAAPSGDVHFDVYLYPSGPKMNEVIYKANKAGEKVFG